MPSAVVTGIGVRTPGGNGLEEFWHTLTSGRTVTRPISFFDAGEFRSRAAGECDFDAEAEGLTRREVRRMDRATQFAVACARDAIADSGLDLDRLDPHRTGVSLGTALGSINSLEREYVVLSDGGRERVVDPAYASPHLYDYLTPSTAAVEVAWTVRAEGPVSLVTDGCTAGLDAVGQALRIIRDGAADVVVAGATEAAVTPIVVACFDAIRATSTQGRCRPFDRARDGIVLAEGAAVLVIESDEHARRRGARVYAELSGFATRFNAFHMTGLTPEGPELAEAVRAALADARADVDDIDYVNAHGTGTAQNDRHETAAIKASLLDRARRIPVSSIKSMIGHSLGAVGSIELAACALVLDRGVVPPTANLHDPDPDCDLDYVPLTAREHRVGTLVSVGSGFGGFQSAAVLRRPS
ncbi:beta-ketoacyl-[acyl-carrier-protein] synthase family protein [Actinophytocola oryzae]|uniref:Act minimal PKS ketosynthase (KS/KS alpha) n=1 Tax=Actinophytocola oryzae TaxID=502181 RepID=A0A4R7US65_9PSEU|nr:beta-ketoacyl-[acyl-carrier-protein] synthase family protein [Actinophytocola oryzae]TDV38603.1 act minimal PKS ketosynthase (KS/KS alpha) [Actinophytocola oryzae]